MKQVKHPVVPAGLALNGATIMRRLTALIIVEVTPDSVSLVRPILEYFSSGSKGLVTVNLRGVCNADQGGEIRDVTEITHGSYFELAVKAASAVGVKFCGVDVITDDIRKPFDEAGCMVNEVNMTPALYIFDAPNSSRDTGIGEIIVKRLFRQ